MYDKALIRSLRPQYVQIREVQDKKRLLLFDTHDNIDLMPEFDTNETGLTVAPGQNLDESHRHLSPYMAIYPLGLLNVEDKKEKDIINKSLRWIEMKGTRNWCGYSF
jgi:alpha-L-fucosidase 2